MWMLSGGRNFYSSSGGDLSRGGDFVSRLVFKDSITQTVERARTISDRIQHTPSEQQNEQYDQDKDALKRCLDDVLDLMNKEASFSG
jgi:hypothetical protein